MKAYAAVAALAAASLCNLSPSRAVAGPTPGGDPNADVQIVALRIRPMQVRAGQQLRVEFDIRNASGSALPSQGPPPRTRYGQHESWRSRGYDALPGRFRVGLTYAGSRGEQYPFRWGMGGTLPPGGFRRVVGYVRMTQPGHYTFFPAVIQEGGPIWEGRSRGLVRVLPRGPVTGHRRYRTIGSQIVVNGEPVVMDVPPKMIGATMMVPLRFVGYGLGAQVEWRPERREAVIRGNRRTITARIGDSMLRFNGQTITSYEPPRIIQGRTMVPLRVIAYALGAQVDWDARTRVVSIRTPDAPRGTGLKRVSFAPGEEAPDEARAETDEVQAKPLVGVTFADEPGRVYALARPLGEAMGWRVHWDGGTLYLNGREVDSEAIRRLPDGRRLIAVRQLSDLGAAVTWEAEQNRARVERDGRQVWIAPGEKRVAVNRDAQQMRAWQGDLLVLDTRVSTGRPGQETPPGNYTTGPLKTELLISRRYGNARMPWSVQIQGDIVIHGFESVPPRAASRGCVRLPLTGANPARWFYHWVDIGTPVVVKDGWPEA